MKYAKEILKDYKPEKRHFGQLVFVDEKLRSFGTIELMRLFNSTQKGFLVIVDKRGKYKPLNPYRDRHNKILPRTLGRLLKNKNEIERDIKKRKKDEKNARSINPDKIVPTTSTSLPRKVLVLDIETVGELNENPNPKRISVVGIKEFNLASGGFQPSPYEYYDGSDDWSALKSRLNQPFDIILGHNLFGFDYYFLEDILDLPRLMPKTVDLFLWLYTCTGSHNWLGLDKLCQMNLGVWKLRSGKSVKKLASLADKSLLHRYNERDLDLTFRLWLHATEKKVVKTLAFGTLKAAASDLDYLLGHKGLVDYQLWIEKPRAWKSNQPSPLNSAVVVKKLGTHDADKICWQTYSVIVCGNCKAATVYLVSEMRERVSGKNEDGHPHRILNGNLKAHKLQCANCNDSIGSRSAALPVQIGNFEIKERQKRAVSYCSAMSPNCAGDLLSPFGKTREELFREFKLGRRSKSSISFAFARKPTRREATLLSAAVSDGYKQTLNFNKKRSIYTLFERGGYENASLCEMHDYLKEGLDLILENHWRRDTSWICLAGIKKDFCCQTCGHPLTIHDLPLIHPVFKTPLCQSCIRLGRHRYFHHGQWSPELKRRRVQFSDVLIPTNGAWNLGEYFAS